MPLTTAPLDDNTARVIQAAPIGTCVTDADADGRNRVEQAQ
ncbi:hypothetical protein BDK63_003198 [Halomonas campaniensis]|uniref:Uncharacterized protein n=1 Tax=Halomonas campaniensis TaxID=213554 RepID=A0A7W5K5J2_9GAMM|nr:hypothetical protein [Halomonas campaniensis]MBB3332304.1 hypothetical protein [Halomonas campaniensis]